MTTNLNEVISHTLATLEGLIEKIISDGIPLRDAIAKKLNPRSVSSQTF